MATQRELKELRTPPKPSGVADNGLKALWEFVRHQTKRIEFLEEAYDETYALRLARTG